MFYRHWFKMSGISKKTPCFILSLTNILVVSIVFILLIGTGCKMCADGSSMHEARAVVEDFYSRYNATTAVDLVFVLDRSESVTRSGWYSIIKFVKVSGFMTPESYYTYDDFCLLLSRENNF